jgi:DUF917 family protein
VHGHETGGAADGYLLALVDGEPVASCPDLLCALDRRTSAPIAVDALRVGDDVRVVVLGGPGLQELLGIDLADPAERLALCLACRSVLFHT